MSDDRFPRVVSLACHDLRTPLATVYGFARTLSRGGELGVLARIESDRYEVGLVEADTLELATTQDERVETVGDGATLETDVQSLKRALQALAVAAARHGGVPTVTWTVRGRELELAPVTSGAARVVTAEELLDFGSIVARRVIERLGGSVELDGETLRVRL